MSQSPITYPKNRKNIGQIYKNNNQKSHNTQNTKVPQKNIKQQHKIIPITQLKAMSKNDQNKNKYIISRYNNQNKLYDYSKNKNTYNPNDYLPHQSFEKLSDKLVQKIVDKVIGCKHYHQSIIQGQRTMTSRKMGQYKSIYGTQQNKKGCENIEQFRLEQVKINFHQEKSFQQPYNSLLLNKNISKQQNYTPKNISTSKISIYHPKIVYDSLKDNRICGIACCDEGECYGTQEQIMKTVNKFK